MAHASTDASSQALMAPSYDIAIPQVQVMPIVRPPEQITDIISDPFFGQKHSYSVVFRGNGQAVVFLRVAFANSSDMPMRELTFELPSVEPEGVLVYQIIKEKQCASFDYTKPIIKPDNQYPCLKYAEPVYNDNFYGNNTYKKVYANMNGNELTIEFPDYIAPQQSGAILIYFRAFGYATKDIFGAYNYRFETLRTDDVISELNIGISTDSELYLRGSQGRVDYYRDTSSMVSAGKTMSEGYAFRSTAFDNAINNIGYGAINKKTSNLMPLDSYQATGAYSNSLVRLYGRTILTVLAVVATILIVIFLIVRKIRRSLTTKTDVSQQQVHHALRNFAISSLVGFVCSIIMFVTLVIVYFCFGLLSRLNYSSDFMLIPFLLGLTILGGIGFVIIIFPCVIVAIKRGVWWGLLTFISALFWLFLAMIVILLIGILFRYSYSSSLFFG